MCVNACVRRKSYKKIFTFKIFPKIILRIFFSNLVRIKKLVISLKRNNLKKYK